MDEEKNFSLFLKLRFVVELRNSEFVKVADDLWEEDPNHILDRPPRKWRKEGKGINNVSICFLLLFLFLLSFSE